MLFLSNHYDSGIEGTVSFQCERHILSLFLHKVYTFYTLKASVLHEFFKGRLHIYIPFFFFFLPVHQVEINSKYNFVFQVHFFHYRKNITLDSKTAASKKNTSFREGV